VPSVLPLAALLALALTAPSTRAQEDGPSSATGPILEAMGDLESKRDAKCHSSACRFENFVFGTPLTDEAREVKVDLQKEMIRGVWSRASVGLDDGGTVPVAALERELERLFQVAETEDGAVRVAFPEREAIELSALRKLQYGSIAYSLRALLAVQQDHLLEGGARLAALDEAGIELLQDRVDTLTLCALFLADERARETSATEIGGALFLDAWRGLVPESAGDDAGATSVAASAASRAEARGLLRAIIAEKTAAYRVYNELDPEEAKKSFALNIERFYALYEIPPDEDERRAFFATFDNAMVSFASQLLSVSAGLAEAAGHELIRADDAVAAVQLLTPHEVDDLEDVRFFPRLEERRRIALEAYDCDSFRDLGRHWGYLERALDGPGSPERTPDPFAAEILAEAASQYGVLVLRIAGDIARKRGEARTLQPIDVQRGAQRVLRWARENREATAKPAARARITSAPTRTGVDRRGQRAARFVDVTAGSGIDFVHRSSPWLSEFRRERTSGPPTFSGGGVAAEDVDGDGDVDLLFVGGIGLGLYANDGKGGFTDVSEAAGLTWRRPDGTTGEARTPLIADLDNDGHQDLLITFANDAHRLYRGLGGGRFEDRTEGAGLGGAGRVGGPATLFDFDGDGLLDVYLCGFGDYLAGEIPTVDRDNRNGLSNRLLRNLGGLRFEDVTEESGTGDTGWCQAVSHTDLDRDGRQDLVVANDFGRNVLLRNRGDGTFENVAPALGMTKAYHSMNVGIADLNADDHPDIYISNIATLVKDNKYVLPDVYTPMDFDYRAMSRMLVKESDVLYMSRVEDGGLRALEPSQDVERGSTSTGWAWDAEFLDLDHDGDDDLYVVNGTNDYNFYASIDTTRGEDGKVRHRYLSHSRESNVLFVNEGGKLRNASEGSGADLVLNSRSTAYLDADGDGDLDVAINNFHSPAVLLENRLAAGAGGWVAIRLQGDPREGSNRDAIGARITVTGPDGLRVVREIQGGSGYLSMNPRAAHFGVAGAETVDAVVVWPGGASEELSGLLVGRTHLVRQGEGVVDPR
jgi:hypothetical protein